MKMKLLFIVMVIYLCSGCEDTLDRSFDNSSPDRLVVEGAITTDTTAHTVVLSRSGDFFDKAPQVMETGAAVTISDEDTTFLLTETEPGIYRTDSTVFGTIGKTYTLKIITSGDSIYTASEKIVGLPDIDSIKAIYNKGFDENAGRRVDGYSIEYFGYETKGIGNYYLWNLYIDNKLYSDSIQKKFFTGDDFVDGNYIRDFELFFINESDLDSDTTDIIIEMFSISKEYNDFLTGLMLETYWRGSPFDGPPANAVSNISNGALGYFRASDRKTATTIIIKQQEVR